VTKAEAKRCVCDMAAKILETVTPERCYVDEYGEMLHNAESKPLLAAWNELIDELSRRGKQ